MNSHDIRPGRNRFPYGNRHDMGISLERVVGSAEIPGTTEGETYVAITLHKGYHEYAVASLDGGERTIYVKASLLGPASQSAGEYLVTVRLGQSFQIVGNGTITGRVAGVVGAQGLVGLFSWRVSSGTLTLFPDSAMTVFNDVLTPADINGTSWGGESAYSAATTGSPLYYFFWDPIALKLAAPVRRVVPTDDGASPYPQSSAYYGIFVPIDGNGNPQSPIAAYMLTWDNPTTACAGGVSMLNAELTAQSDDTVAVGSADITDSAEWGPLGGASTDVHGLDGGTVAPFDYNAEFATASSDGHTSGYLFAGWYNSALAVDDPAQNPNRLFVTGSALQLVHLLDDYLGFAGTAESPELLHLKLTPVVGQSPSVAAELEFTLTDTAATGAGEASAPLACTYSADTSVRHCYGSFYSSMWVTFYNVKTIKYKALTNGSSAGQLLSWDTATKSWVAGSQGVLPNHLMCWNNSSKRWQPGLAGNATGQSLKWAGSSSGWQVGFIVPNGTVKGQLLSWDDGSWVAGLLGTATGQVMKWTGTTWSAGTASSMPTGSDKNTLFYDGTTGWTANVKLKWDKLATGSPSSGGVLLLDLTGCPARDWASPMPGIAFNHPSGGTCGLFANIESGSNAGARLDLGWGGANGGNFELYSNTHPTRPGEFRIIYGPNGHIEFKNFQSGTDWHVTSGLSKEGRFFCGFCDVQYPGVTGNFGTYVAPAFPLQIFNEAHQDSKIVAGVSKEGRGFFGCLGNPATGLPAYPLEIYNEAGATAAARVAGISKNGRAFFGVSGATAPTPEHPLEVYNEAGSTAAARKMYVTKDGKIVTSATVSSIAHTAQLDCNDIAMTTGATAQTVKLREMVMPYKSGSAVKGKLAQVMCGVGYGDELDLGGLPAGATAGRGLICNASGVPTWVDSIVISLS